MRPPWLTPQEGDDTETLQTDVMRFLAILGLCLTAIFSLVQSASMETAMQLPPEKTVDSPRPAGARETLQPSQQQQKQLAPKPSPPTPVETDASDASDQGFTMGFTSASVMQALLVTGTISLYAHSDQGYWQLQDGGFVASAPPQSYYEMDASTVPGPLSVLLTAVAGSRANRWGVTLPESTVSDIERIMSRQRGGELVIDASGRVSIDAQ